MSKNTEMIKSFYPMSFKEKKDTDQVSNKRRLLVVR